VVSIPGGCIGNCDGQHPGMDGHPAIHNRSQEGGSSSISMSSVTFVDVAAGGYRIVSDWLMPGATARCTERGPQMEASTSVGWVLIYDPDGNLVYARRQVSPRR
jgi:hypothetical protein